MTEKELVKKSMDAMELYYKSFGVLVHGALDKYDQDSTGELALLSSIAKMSQDDLEEEHENIMIAIRRSNGDIPYISGESLFGDDYVGLLKQRKLDYLRCREVLRLYREENY